MALLTSTQRLLGSPTGDRSEIGQYPSDIKQEDGTYAIDRARVTPQDPIDLDDIDTTVNKEWGQMTLGEKVWTVVKNIFYYLLFPITYPIKLIAELGVRLSIFLADLFHSSCGAWMLKTSANADIDLERINETKEAFKAIGAEITTTVAADGQEVEMMRLTQEGFREAMHTAGGEFVERIVVVDDDHPTEFREAESGENVATLRTIEINPGSDSAAYQKYVENLEKAGWRKVTVHTLSGETKEVMQYSLYRDLDEGGMRGVEEGEREVVMRFHPFIIFYPFEKRYLVDHMAMGKDLVFLDVRGGKKTDKPSSEEGVYMDAEAAYLQVRDGWGYDANNIWVTGRCSGNTVVSHLRERFADDDFHMVNENAFTSFPDVLKRRPWPISWLGRSVIGALRARNDETMLAAGARGGVAPYCDYFHSVRKLESAAQLRPRTTPAKARRVVVISTDTDKLIGPESGVKIARSAAKTADQAYHFVHRGRPGRDGHHDDIWKDYELFGAYAQVMGGGHVQFYSNFRGVSDKA